MSHAGGSLFRIGVNAMPFLMPLLFVDDFGWTPVRAGELVLALFAGNLLIKPATTPILRRFGFRPTLLGATLGSALTIASCAGLSSDTPPVVIVALLFVRGAFRTVAFADIGAGHLADANALSSVTQQLALGFGAAVGALALRAASSIDPRKVYAIAFVLVAVLFVLPAVDVARLPRAVGAALTGRARSGPGRIRRCGTVPPNAPWPVR